MTVSLKVYFRTIRIYVFNGKVMKLKKGQVSNLVFLVVIVVILFTPVGTAVKVWVNRFIAFSPGIIDADDRKLLTDYNWRLEDAVTGDIENLEQMKGEVVLVNLWATWCPPCIAEMPSMQALYDSYGDKVNFLFVTSDKKASVENFMSEHKYTFPVYYERSSIPAELFSRSIPATYLIDKEGRIVIDKTGAADWNSQQVRDQLDFLLKQ